MRNNSYLCRMNAAKKAMKMTVLMALLLPCAAFGQDTTRVLEKVDSKFSLVWELIPNQKWVVYNKTQGTEPLSFDFGYINPSGTNSFFSTAQEIDAKDIFVNEMYISAEAFSTPSQ